jgi:hypothetical protein
MCDEAVEPCPGSLTKAVEGAGQEADVIRLCWINEAGWLLAVDLLTQVAVQERVGDI